MELVKPALILLVLSAVNGCISKQKDQCDNRLNGVTNFQGSFKGEVQFTYVPNSKSYSMTGQVSGFAPNSIHGIHIHQLGNLGQACVAAGPHFNPNAQVHGSPTSIIRHAGDLGNFQANGKGVIDLQFSLSESAFGGCNQIIGRALVIHSLRDDLGLGGNDESKRTGNAGARLTCAVIGIAA